MRADFLAMRWAEGVKLKPGVDSGMRAYGVWRDGHFLAMVWRLTSSPKWLALGREYTRLGDAVWCVTRSFPRPVEAPHGA